MKIREIIVKLSQIGELALMTVNAIGLKITALNFRKDDAKKQLRY